MDKYGNMRYQSVPGIMPFYYHSNLSSAPDNHLPSHFASVRKVVVALPDAVASRDASALEEVFAGQRCMGPIRAPGLVVVVVRQSAAVAGPVHFVKVRVY